ncbi:hypothetical protein BJR05_18640 [Bacillus cereus]|nr:hypothetical protein BJR05_18640 [Bacillus cereus]
MEDTMIIIDNDGEGYWSKTVDLGILGKFNSIFIDLDGCDITGAMDNMNQKVEKATKYYGNRFKELETNVGFITFQSQ